MSIRINAQIIAERNQRKETEKVLKWAVEHDAVQVYYQPIYSIERGKIQALEALARIVDEDGRLFMPDSFIPIAEENGMILELGNSVLAKTCDFMNQEKLSSLGIEYVDVNLSVVQCMQKNLADVFLDIMAERGILPPQINLEITETAVLHSEKSLLDNMKKLIKTGTTFSLDDYGTGYSNLSYVVNLPVKTIKFDKKMVMSYFSNHKSSIVMRHEVAMLHELGLSIVAEGVENKEQYSAMKELGIDYIQGYYFSKPVSSNQIVRFLKEWM
ncbi:MAG TPA: EAL domain-containing protein [Lachnospiraceae bacterium]|nr:EAL domain-containing protein [Lachnospiraceae bacterium]